MTIHKCKICGRPLEDAEGKSVCTCSSCGAKQTLPRTEDENLQSMFNRANVLRMRKEYDKALEIYEKIIQEDGKEAEAYWGLVLCKYGISYAEGEQDWASCFQRVSFRAMSDDSDFQMALKCADPEQKAVYEAEAAGFDARLRELMPVKPEKPVDAAGDSVAGAAAKQAASLAGAPAAAQAEKKDRATDDEKVGNLNKQVLITKTAVVVMVSFVLFTTALGLIVWGLAHVMYEMDFNRTIPLLCTAATLIYMAVIIVYVISQVKKYKEIKNKGKK